MNGELGPDLLSAYLDGELDAADRRAVEELLAADDRWRAELAAVRSARALVRALPWREPPAGALDALVARVASAPLASGPAPVVAIDEARKRRVARAAGIAGAAAAVAVTLALVQSPDRQEVAPQIASLTQSHAAVGGAGSDPLTQVVPVGVEAGP